MAADPAETDRPLVSIVIPSYNGARWIREAVRSALDQTLSDIELIVCDDASTDGTTDVLAEFSDSRLHVVPHDRNVGLAANWNRGIQLARGRYTKLLMQDDVLHPQALELMASAFADNPGAGLVYCERELLVEEDDVAGVRWAREFGVLWRGGAVPQGQSVSRQLLHEARRTDFRRNLIGEPSVAMMDSCVLASIGGFNLELRQLTDWEMWIRLAAVAPVIHLPVTLCKVRVHTNSATRMNLRSRSAWLDRAWLLLGLMQTVETKALVQPRHALVAALAAFRAGAVPLLLRSPTHRSMFRRLLRHLTKSGARRSLHETLS